jgi:hypothetical protein
MADPGRKIFSQNERVAEMGKKFSAKSGAWPKWVRNFQGARGAWRAAWEKNL